MSDGQSILIIEDDETWQTILRETLEDEGYAVTAVATYHDGRQALEKHFFDLVLLDLELDESAPMLEGERLLKHLLQHHAETPCVIVSGQGDVRIVRDALVRYRAADFIAKDRRFDLLAFVETVKGVLKRWQGTLEQGSGGQQRLSRLLQLISASFDESELRTLCFHLDIDYEDLPVPAQGKTNKVRALIQHLQRRRRVPELIAMGKQLRPDVSWE